MGDKRTDIRFNMNDQVKVRLKQRGIDILRQHHDELDKRIRSSGGKGLSPFTLRIDDNGYTTFQMWDLMQKFGEHMVMGFEPPFHPDVIVCDGEIIEQGD